jgi:hypothetical protein
VEYVLDSLMGGGNPMGTKRVTKAMNNLRKMIERV